MISVTTVRELLEAWQDLERDFRERPPLEVDLGSYDAFLESGASDQEQPKETITAKEERA